MFSRTYGERDGDNIGGESGNDDFNIWVLNRFSWSKQMNVEGGGALMFLVALWNFSLLKGYENVLLYIPI